MRQCLAWVVAITLAIATVLATGHRHADHGSNDPPCAVCAVTHHVGALSEAPVVAIRPPAPVALGAAPLADAPDDLDGRRESGRAPPSPTHA